MYSFWLSVDLHLPNKTYAQPPNSLQQFLANIEREQKCSFFFHFTSTTWVKCIISSGTNRILRLIQFYFYYCLFSLSLAIFFISPHPIVCSHSIILSCVSAICFFVGVSVCVCVWCKYKYARIRFYLMK